MRAQPHRRLLPDLAPAALPLILALVVIFLAVLLLMALPARAARCWPESIVNSKTPRNAATETVYSVTRVSSTTTWGFASSSGTSGCGNTALLSPEDYAADSAPLLAQDLARGGGPWITALAALLDVPAAERPRFVLALRARLLAPGAQPATPGRLLVAARALAPPASAAHAR